MLCIWPFYLHANDRFRNRPSPLHCYACLHLHHQSTQTHVLIRSGTMVYDLRGSVFLSDLGEPASFTGRTPGTAYYCHPIAQCSRFITLRTKPARRTDRGGSYPWARLERARIADCAAAAVNTCKPRTVCAGGTE